MRISVLIAGSWLYLLFLVGLSCLIHADHRGFDLWTVGHLNCICQLFIGITGLAAWGASIIVAGVNMCVGKFMAKHLAATWIYVQICIISGMAIGHNVNDRIQTGLAVFVGGFVVYALLRMTWWSLKTVVSTKPRTPQTSK